MSNSITLMVKKGGCPSNLVISCKKPKCNPTPSDLHRSSSSWIAPRSPCLGYGYEIYEIYMVSDQDEVRVEFG